MSLNSHSSPLARNYPILLKELVAALVAGFLIAFAVVGLWLIASPSLSLVFILAFISLGVLLLSYFSVRLILVPHRSRVQRGLATFGLARWEDIGFRATDGIVIGAWYVPPRPEADGATLIYLHGLGGNRGELASQVAMLARHGYGALVLDMRNHGRSGRAMTTLGHLEVEDVRGAVAYLESRAEVNPERIGIFGHSMGAATAVCAAARIPQIRAVVAQNTFTSLTENIEAGVITQLGLPPFPFVPLIAWLGELTSGLRIKMVRPIDEVAKISPRAILFIHGREDRYVSSDNSRRLYAAAYEPKALHLINQGDHNALALAESNGYENKVTVFLERYLLGYRP